MNMQRVLAGVVAVIFAFVLTASAQNSPIRISVDPKNSRVAAANDKAPSDKKPGSKRSAETQQQILVITLQNVGNKSYSGLTVQHTIFAKNTSTGAIAAAGNGQQTVDLPSLQTRKVETAPAQVTPPSPAARKKDDKPSGQEFAGYCVKVLQGGNLLAEYWSHPSLKGGTTESGKEKTPAAPATKPKGK